MLDATPQGPGTLRTTLEPVRSSHPLDALCRPRARCRRCLNIQRKSSYSNRLYSCPTWASLAEVEPMLLPPQAAGSLMRATRWPKLRAEAHLRLAALHLVSVFISALIKEQPMKQSTMRSGRCGARRARWRPSTRASARQRRKRRRRHRGRAARAPSAGMLHCSGGPDTVPCSVLPTRPYQPGRKPLADSTPFTLTRKPCSCLPRSAAGKLIVPWTLSRTSTLHLNSTRDWPAGLRPAPRPSLRPSCRRQGRRLLPGARTRTAARMLARTHHLLSGASAVANPAAVAQGDRNDQHSVQSHLGVLSARGSQHYQCSQAVVVWIPQGFRGPQHSTTMRGPRK